MNNLNMVDWLTLIFSMLSVILAFWQIIRTEGMQPAEGISVAYQLKDISIETRARTLHITAQALTDMKIYAPQMVIMINGIRQPARENDKLTANMMSVENGETLEATIVQHENDEITIIIQCLESSPIRREPVAWGWKYTINTFNLNAYGSHPLLENSVWRWYPCSNLIHLLNQLLQHAHLHYRLPVGYWKKPKEQWNSLLPALEPSHDPANAHSPQQAE
ncbi:hypothetical protein [Alloscardovia omnicolens]|uniref:Uncharacterized protein n=1 Tax=Alloscardovia omnicolens F0580 TaxID=1321816 RepID=U1R873_9BIFI|nr:hypothetical protein [Alloscardovia omnicolens]ERH29759.1 hypothetical protein HMPREF9244_01559 [Alloscardovia omnicolens F0580]MBS6347102.1 hypothetical protein [Alloscardovia omnicolens]MDK6643108.1 hypothetical protein [Alloscardovia omnicolens]